MALMEDNPLATHPPARGRRLAGSTLAVGLAGVGWLLGLGPGCLLKQAPRNVGQPALAYPITAPTHQVDVYHGLAVADPYRWLEDESSPATRRWIEAQNRVTFGYLEQIPVRAALSNRLARLWNYERYSVPVRRGSRYFFTRNDGLQNQSVLYTAASLDEEPRVLLDPNRLSPDGTIALSGTVVSEDGRYLAYGLATAGSDWQEWRVRETGTGQDLPDHLRWIKFSGASWTPDGQGFFYSRYDAPPPGTRLSGVNQFQKLYYHRLGTPQAEDRLIYERPDHKDWGFRGTVTEDGRYLIITVWKGTETRNGIFYQDLAAGTPVVELLRDFDADYTFLNNDGPVFWFRTDLGAPRGRVIAIDLTRPGREHWRELIPESAATLRNVNVVHDRFIAQYLKDAHSRVRLFNLDGTFLRELVLPGLGSAAGFGGRRQDTETFYSFTSFTVPGTIYRLDMRTGQSTVFRRPAVDFNPDEYETRQVFYSSRDGTRIPMFLTHRRGLKQNGRQAVYLYGYGGFNISLTPSFSPAQILWLEMGGIYAVPNLRGGGEYGKAWHEAGIKLRKQNVFDDFMAAAEWLIASRYTRPDKLAIGGGSNGGLLVGACLTQRPDLFGAALPAVGVMDMLRFHKFTIGWAWVSDYGSPDNPDEFKALLAYSPLHNLKPGTAYPATLITTADHDDRVVPAHSFKFAAALQSAHAGPQPVLIRIETRAGHGAGKPTAKLIEESADRWAFLARALDLKLPARLAGSSP